ncbi:hypothetical protein BJ875DRAFT_466039 [Amylocarpus encephaloides]|uniref:Tat pathway signal sequence n=1 Tax=Amylocarpus encephaloides TaxID=45428 RepID=A0A9P8C421_9HELO|nr:hypothetical protein BJ875DRAFT_466039 [Amylocarpus encephaloides]
MYTPLQNRSEEGEGSQSSCDQLLEKESYESYRPSRSNRKRFFIPVFVTIATTLLAFILGTWVGSQKFAPTNRKYLEHVQNYSPILKEADTSIHKVSFNGSFMKENVFRQGAGPEVDAAWESLGVNYRSVAIPVSEASASGLTPSHVQINSKYGGGFPANVEGLHHLHCLNLLRQSLYFNYNYYHEQGIGAFKNKDSIIRFHVTHCLDIIRQQLMCRPDTGVLGQVWWDKAAPKAFVDFNTGHKCRNFEAVRKWAEERQIDDSVPEDFLMPPGDSEDVYDAIP